MELALKVANNFFAFVGGIASLVAIYQFILPLRKITWRRVTKGVLKVKDKLIDDHYLPTLIVGIGRGGAVTGALLSGTLQNVPLLVIDRVYDWSEGMRQDCLLDNISIDKNLDKVLLVAGELHTGKTAKIYCDYFQSLGAKEVRVFSFLKEKYPTLQPRYWSVESDNPDLRLPWMVTENYLRDSKKARE